MRAIREVITLQASDAERVPAVGSGPYPSLLAIETEARQE